MTAASNGLGRLGPKGRAAVEQLRRGWHVHPLKPDSKEPATPHGFKDATDDLGRVVRRWLRCPDDNIGVATGASRLLVVDLDTEAGADHCGAAVAALCALADGRDLPESFEVETPSGGAHWYYRVPDGVEMPPCSTKRLSPNIDTRALGGYVVAARSTLPAGAYSIVNDVPVAEAPAWLIEACRRPASPPVGVPAPPGRVSAGARSIYGERALLAECGRVALAPVGARNDTLNRAGFALGQLVAGGVLDARDVVDGLLVAAARCGLGQLEAERTLTGALAAGAREPRRPAA